MALYRTGNSGEPVRDIQDRLVALGYEIADDAGDFGPSTLAAVKAFQEARNLTSDGMVGRETWRTLVDSGYRLGDRLLYYRLPMLHGDDVSQLQRQLNAIGFEAGIVDGIFGPDTLRALIDFQQNRHLAEDGIAGPVIVGELTLISRATQKLGRQDVRERVWLNSLPDSVAGQRVFLDPFCRDEHESAIAWEAAVAAASVLREIGAVPVMSRSADTCPPERARAHDANELAVDIIVSFALPRTDIPAVFFFASPLSRSGAGESLAGFIATRLDLTSEGRVTPMLRETRAPSITVTVPRLGAEVGRSVASGVDAWAHEVTSHDDQSPSSVV